MIVRQGEKWGALECTHAGKVVKDIRATDADGNEYIAHREVVNGYHLQCTCGNVLELSKKEFKGKRITRDCGCGAAGFSGENVVITISTNSGVKGHLQQLARLDGQTVSYIANEAFRLYFESRSNGTVWNLEPRKRLEVTHVAGSR
jgi:hypothetical protein